MMAMAGDLEGILVVSVEQAVAAPYAAVKLADAGARVIKVERPEGDFARLYDADAKGMSSYFVWLNRGKESICLDLKTEADRQLLLSLIGEADVFIQNLMPGAFDRMGIDLDDLAARHEKLILCSISGYGSSGEFSQMKAYDLLVQAECGLAAITGSPQEAGRVGVSICDIAAGMTAHQAIMQALYARTKTGRGRKIELSLFHALSDWMNVPYLQHHYGGRTIKRPGLHHPTIAPYGVYPCGDGGMILLSIQNEREWRRLAEDVLGDAGLVTDPRFDSNINRVAHRGELDAIIIAAFARDERDAVATRLHAAGIAFGRLNSIDDLIAHPQTRFIETRTSEGELRLIAPGAVMEGMAASGKTVPEKDEHGAAIRQQFGRQ